jgi:hypothetical protein
MEKDSISDNSLPGEAPGKNEAERSTDGATSEITTTLWERFRSNKKAFGIFRSLFIVVLSLVTVLFLLLYILYIVPSIQEIPSGHKTETAPHEEVVKDAAYKKAMNQLSKDIQRLSRKYQTYSPGQTYILINTTENKFYLYKNKKLVREGSCSTGSYKKLVAADGKSWIFRTPRGRFEIRGKRTNPVWHKPDWAFVEEGVPIPPANSRLRWEAGVLGDYALDLEDSYMIHGTIYKRFLGMPVTHGCVRMNDEDLEVVFNTLNMGSKVFIY